MISKKLTSYQHWFGYEIMLTYMKKKKKKYSYVTSMIKASNMYKIASKGTHVLHVRAQIFNHIDISNQFGKCT